MPTDLMALMRHESIETTLRYYVGRNAQATAKTLWDAHKKATNSNSFGNRAAKPSLSGSMGRAVTGCRSKTYKVRPAGFEPATSGLEIRCSIP
jgi:hypothetical protein